MIMDSGTRHEFASGAARDIPKGKGRCDLLPLREVAELIGDEHGEDQVLMDINYFMQTRDTGCLFDAIKDFCRGCGEDIADMVLEVSVHYEEGAEKYSERNWQKGLPLHSFVNSGVRHYLKYIGGQTDERHDRAFVWNMLGLIWTFRNCSELDDLPGARR